MRPYIVVYVNSAKSHLAKWIAGSGMYETVAEGQPSDLKRLAEQLNEASK